MDKAYEAYIEKRRRDDAASARNAGESVSVVERWRECEMCGHAVSPQAAVYGMPIHGECWARMSRSAQAIFGAAHGCPALGA